RSGDRPLARPDWLRCGVGDKCSSVLADHDEHRPHRNDLAFGDENAPDLPRRRGRDLDRRLVGLDLDQRVVLGDLLTLLDEPAGDLALGQALAEVRKLELVRHQNSVSTRCAAAATRSADGMYASSICQNGYGTSKPVTRSTGPRRSRIAFSAITAASSAPKPATRGASRTIPTHAALHNA